MALAVELRETRVCVDEKRSSEHVLFHAVGQSIRIRVCQSLL